MYGKTSISTVPGSHVTLYCMPQRSQNPANHSRVCIHYITQFYERKYVYKYFINILLACTQNMLNQLATVSIKLG